MGVSFLAHVELLCPDLDASAAFFTDVFGMQMAAELDGSVYLRCYGDWPHHTLVLTPADAPGVGHIAWGVDGPETMAQIEGELRRRDIRYTSVQEPGQGEALRFTAPGGHVHELLYDVGRTHPAEIDSRLHNQPHRFRGRGVEPRRIDHVNVLAPDVPEMSTFLQHALGLLVREAVQAPTGEEAGHWLSITSNVHDIAVMRDASATGGRLHHLAFWLDTRERVMRGADLLVESDARIEAGPGKHGVTQAFFLYFFEPSGNRIEVFSSGYQIFEPGWEPILWTTEDKDRVEIAMTGFRIRDYVAEMARPVG